MKQLLLQKLKIANNKELELADISFITESDKITIKVNEEFISLLSLLELVNSIFHYMEESSENKSLKIEYIFEETTENF